MKRILVLALYFVFSSISHSSPIMNDPRLKRFFEVGLGLQSYFSDILIQKDQGGSFESLVRNYEVNQGLGQIPNSLRIEELMNNPSIQLLEIFELLKQSHRNLEKSDSADNSRDEFDTAAFGLLHTLISLKSSSLENPTAYSQLISAMNRTYYFRHSSGAADPELKKFMLHFLMSYTKGFPIDEVDLMVNDLAVNEMLEKDPTRKNRLRELNQNLSLFGFERGTKPIGFFSISESEYRYRLANRALYYASNFSFKYPQKLTILDAYRRASLENAFFREARIGLLKKELLQAADFSNERPFSRLFRIIWLLMTLYGVWGVLLICILKIGFHKNHKKNVQLNISTKKPFSFITKALSKSISFILTLALALVVGIKVCFLYFFSSEIRKNFYLEFSLIVFALTWILSNFNNEMAAYLGK